MFTFQYADQLIKVSPKEVRFYDSRLKLTATKEYNGETINYIQLVNGEFICYGSSGLFKSRAFGYQYPLPIIHLDPPESVSSLDTELSLKFTQEAQPRFTMIYNDKEVEDFCINGEGYHDIYLIVNKTSIFFLNYIYLGSLDPSVLYYREYFINQNSELKVARGVCHNPSPAQLNNLYFTKSGVPFYYDSKLAKIVSVIPDKRLKEDLEPFKIIHLERGFLFMLRKGELFIVKDHLAGTQPKEHCINTKYIYDILAFPELKAKYLASKDDGIYLLSNVAKLVNDSFDNEAKLSHKTYIISNSERLTVRISWRQDDNGSIFFIEKLSGTYKLYYLDTNAENPEHIVDMVAATLDKDMKCLDDNKLDDLMKPYYRGIHSKVYNFCEMDSFLAIYHKNTVVKNSIATIITEIKENELEKYYLEHVADKNVITGDDNYYAFGLIKV